jgi:hypothetical protein
MTFSFDRGLCFSVFIDSFGKSTFGRQEKYEMEHGEKRLR